MTEEKEVHSIFKKKGANGAIDYITCLTCNESYPSAEMFLKDHLNCKVTEA